MKDKCYIPTGGHKCEKPLHSCIRKVASHDQVPYKVAWRLLGRGAQGILEAVGRNFEVWSLKVAHAHLTAAVEGLSPGTHQCTKCGRPKEPIVIQTWDANQAFEACSRSTMMQGMAESIRRYKAKYQQDEIYVRKGCQFKYRTSKPHHLHKWIKLKLKVIMKSIWCSSSMSSVAFAGKVWQMSGIPIGGSQSKIGLSLALFSMESPTFDSDGLFQDLGVLRYVDDILMISSGWCDHCMRGWMKSTYGTLFSECSTPGEWPNSKIWLDLDIVAFQGGIAYGARSPNRPFLHGAGNSAGKSHTPTMARDPHSSFQIPPQPLVGAPVSMQTITSPPLNIALLSSLSLF